MHIIIHNLLFVKLESTKILEISSFLLISSSLIHVKKDVVRLLSLTVPLTLDVSQKISLFK